MTPTAIRQLHAIESNYKPITAKLFISTQPNKKYRVVVSNGHRTKTMHFGDKKYDDYTQHGDRKRKNLYIARHKARENWDDAFTPGFWARHLLWNKPTVEKSIVDIRKNHGVEVVGGGLWDKIKSVPGRIKGFFTGRDNNYPPKCREFLAKYGNCPITSLAVYRAPVQSFIKPLLNAISLNTFSDLMKKYGFDKLFHLYCRITFIAPDGSQRDARIE